MPERALWFLIISSFLLAILCAYNFSVDASRKNGYRNSILAFANLFGFMIGMINMGVCYLALAALHKG